MERVRLQSGREVVIRPIRPSDGPELAAAHERLSPQSKYSRFLAPKPHLSLSETRYLVQVDGVDHLAFVATPADDSEQILAVARCVRLPDDPSGAEFAIVVGDRFQHEGLGSALMAQLAAAAQARGVTHLRATMLAENAAVHALVRGIPGTIVAERNHGTVDELEVRLAGQPVAVHH